MGSEPAYLSKVLGNTKHSRTAPWIDFSKQSNAVLTRIHRYVIMTKTLTSFLSDFSKFVSHFNYVPKAPSLYAG
jgi:hypothetical protein